MRPYYSEFVRHCLRYYIKTIDDGEFFPNFRSEADRRNWNACHDVMKDMPKEEKETLFRIYRKGDTIADNIYHLSIERGVTQDALWAVAVRLERKIAKKRGLL